MSQDMFEAIREDCGFVLNKLSLLFFIGYSLRLFFTSLLAEHTVWSENVSLAGGSLLPHGVWNSVLPFSIDHSLWGRFLWFRRQWKAQHLSCCCSFGFKESNFENWNCCLHQVSLFCWCHQLKDQDPMSSTPLEFETLMMMMINDIDDDGNCYWCCFLSLWRRWSIIHLTSAIADFKSSLNEIPYIYCECEAKSGANGWFFPSSSSTMHANGLPW